MSTVMDFETRTPVSQEFFFGFIHHNKASHVNALGTPCTPRVEIDRLPITIVLFDYFIYN